MRNVLLQTTALAVILTFLGMVACGGEEDQDTTSSDRPSVAETSEIGKSEGLPWDAIPLYSGAKLEKSEPCPPQWRGCEVCESRVYLTEDSPETVCAFYKDEMSKRDWDRLVFQSYPEGSCMGTWMAEMGDSSGPRVLLTIGKRTGDNSTAISIAMGRSCP